MALFHISCWALIFILKLLTLLLNMWTFKKIVKNKYIS